LHDLLDTKTHVKLSNVGQPLDGLPKIYHRQFLRASEGMLSRWSRLRLQSIALTNPHWARVMGYGALSIRKAWPQQWGLYKADVTEVDDEDM
jgi:hypothetical protein